MSVFAGKHIAVIGFNFGKLMVLVTLRGLEWQKGIWPVIIFNQGL